MTNTYLVRVLAIILIGLVSACQPASECRVKPSFFCEEFDGIHRELPSEDLVELKSASRGDIGEKHLTFGAYIRNRFSLWDDNETTRFFRNVGVNHADAMSYVMAVGFVGYLKGEAVDMEVLSGELTKLPPPPPPPPSSAEPAR